VRYELGLGEQWLIDRGFGVIFRVGFERPDLFMGWRTREGGGMFRIHRIRSESKLKEADTLLSAIIEIGFDSRVGSHRIGSR
jgi:hypothetical protein